MSDFLIDERSAPPNADKICGKCADYQRWECKSKVFAYCGVTHSRRTDNGLLKVKYHQQACGKWRPE